MLKLSKKILLSLTLVLASVVVAANVIITPVIPFANSQQPIPHDNKQKIMLRTTAGNIESASFTIKNDHNNLNQVTVEIDQFVMFGTDIVADIEVSARIVKRWYQARGAWFGHGRYGYEHMPQFHKKILVSELLLNDEKIIEVDRSAKNNYLVTVNGQREKVTTTELIKKRHINPKVSQLDFRDADSLQPINLKKGQLKQYWLTLKIPKSLSPGIYSSTVKLVDKQSMVLAATPIEIEVLGFALQPAGIDYGLYYRSRLRREGTLSSEYKNEIQMQAELANIKAHGVSLVTLYYEASNARKVSGMMRKAGLNQDKLLVIDFELDKFVNNHAKKKYKDKVIKIAGALKEPNVQIYIYGKDEAKGDKLRVQLPYWSLARDAGVNVFMAGYDDALDIAEGNLGLLVKAHKLTTDARLKTRQQNIELFSYGNPQVGLENPFPYRLNYGLALWAYNYDGALLYAYQDGFGFIYNDFDHKTYRDHAFTYPVSDGVIDTIAWEGFREGIDDVRYIRTLEFYLTKVVDKNIDKPVLVKARKFIEKLKQTLVFPTKEKRSPLIEIDLDQIRSTTVGFINEVRPLTDSE